MTEVSLRYNVLFQRYKKNCSYGFVFLLYLQLKMSHNFHTYTFDQHQSPNLTIPEIAISGSANASDTLFSDTSIASSPILQWRPTSFIRDSQIQFYINIYVYHVHIVDNSCTPQKRNGNQTL